MKRFFRVRYLLVLIIALIVATGVLGFAASNTVPSTNAGDGQGVISGYTVAGVTYSLRAADPTLIDTVDFTLAPVTPGASVPATVKVKLVSVAGASWFNCAVSGAASPYDATCDLSANPVSVLAADQLRIVAVQ
jgi:hypothetical protein